jgi:hypothetical protein
MNPLILGLLINLGVPIACVALYLWLRRRSDVDDPDAFVVFLLFAHYGAWLVVILNILSGHWSEAVSLGVMYLVTVGTVTMLVLAGLTFRERKRSIYHRIVFIGAASHLGPVALVFLFILLLIHVFPGP